MGDFHRCIDIVLAEEGGHANHPRDPGGLTNYGIASKSYPNIDIARLTETQAKEIYRRDYWERISGDDLPTGLDLVMLDTAVNMGAVRAIMILQEALGVTLDGTIGEATRARIRQTLPGLINEVCALRAWRYEINRNEDVFGKGWFAACSASMPSRWTGAGRHEAGPHRLQAALHLARPAGLAGAGRLEGFARAARTDRRHAGNGAGRYRDASR